MAEERVQKILARAGYGSRRASEELITAGRVRINGETAVLGSKANPQRDTIMVDNQPIAKEQPPAYIALNKPQGVLSEVSPDEVRKTVRDLVPVPGHLFIVGRLDMDSEGLILLTNDGQLANKLTHPRYGHEKEYRVLVGTRPDDKQLEAWRHGVVLEDGVRTAPAQVRLEGLAGKGSWLRVILNEGRKRQIREMGKLTGVPVLRIQRIRIGTLLLGELKPGQWRHLNIEEIRALRAPTPRTTSTQPGARKAALDSGRTTYRPTAKTAGMRGGPAARGPARFSRTASSQDEQSSARPPRRGPGDDTRPAGRPVRRTPGEDTRPSAGRPTRRAPSEDETGNSRPVRRTPSDYKRGTGREVRNQPFEGQYGSDRPTRGNSSENQRRGPRSEEPGDSSSSRPFRKPGGTGAPRTPGGSSSPRPSRAPAGAGRREKRSRTNK